MLISENVYRNCIIFKKIYAMEISVAQTYCNTFIWKKQVVFFGNLRAFVETAQTGRPAAKLRFTHRGQKF